MERSAMNTERNNGRPTLAADGKSLTFGGRKFHRCADGTFREHRTTRSSSLKTGSRNQDQWLRLELEIEAGR